MRNRMMLLVASALFCACGESDGSRDAAQADAAKDRPVPEDRPVSKDLSIREDRRSPSESGDRAGLIDGEAVDARATLDLNAAVDGRTMSFPAFLLPDASGNAWNLPVGNPIVVPPTVVECPRTAGPTMVKLPLGYCIDSTEVTRAQYARWLNSEPSTKGQVPACTWNTSFVPSKEWPPIGDLDTPVTYVDWCDAFAYCEAVGKRLCGRIGGGNVFYNEGLTSPDEHQWDSACKSYPWSGCNLAAAAVGRTVPVASMKACQSSAAGFEGVYDLVGNVSEWEDSCDNLDGEGDRCMTNGSSYLDGYGCGFVLWSSKSRSTQASTIGFRCCAP
jgi:hypothetical protein